MNFLVAITISKDTDTGAYIAQLITSMRMNNPAGTSDAKLKNIFTLTTFLTAFEQKTLLANPIFNIKTVEAQSAQNNLLITTWLQLNSLPARNES